MRTTGVCVRLCFQSYRLLIAFICADEFESAPAESAGPNAVGVGWGGAADDEDPWAAFEDPTPPPVPIPVTELTSPPEPIPAPTSKSVASPARTLTASAARSSRVGVLSPSPSPRATPLASPAPSERATSPVTSPASVPSTAGMTKEEKVAEMARRKEERKQVRLVSLLYSHSFDGVWTAMRGLCWWLISEDRAVERAEEERRCSKG